MIWKKPDGMKYVDLCIYIDAHAPELIDPNCSEEVQDTIFNYLWLVVKAIAIKKKLFTSFYDYDGYAFYAANRLYTAIKRNLQNQGKVIKGRTITPIKSCLNYMKTLLYPMKLEYLSQEKNLEFQNLETTKNFDAFMYKQHFKQEAWTQLGNNEKFQYAIKDLVQNFDNIINSTLIKLPFKANSEEYKRIKISILLNMYLNLKRDKNLNAEPITVMLWKLPKSTGNYVKLFLKEISATLRQQIISCYENLEISDNVIQYMISNPTGEFKDYENK